MLDKLDGIKAALIILNKVGESRKETIKETIQNGSLRLPLTLQCVDCEDGIILNWLADVPLDDVICKCGKIHLVYWYAVEDADDSAFPSITPPGNGYLC